MSYKARLIDLCRKYSDKVRLNGDMYKRIAESIAFKDFLYPIWHSIQFPKPDLEFAEFVILTNVANFCTFANTNQGSVSGCSKISLCCNCSTKFFGSEAIAMAFKIALNRKIIDLSFEYFASCDFNEKVFFNIIEEIKPRLEFPDERFAMLKNFSRDFLKEYGSVMNLLSYSDWNVSGDSGFISRLSRLSGYSGDEMFFSKRATLCAYMIHARGLSSRNKLLQFLDTEDLPPLSDSHVFNFMTTEKILSVEGSLADRLARGLIFETSKEEDLAIVNSMRAHGAYSVMLLLGEINRLRKEKYLREISIIQLDNYIWSRSRGADYGNAYYPYMLTTNC